MEGKKMDAKVTRRLVNVCTAVGIVLLIILAVAGFRSGILTNEEKLQAFLDSCYPFGPLVFLVIQVAQVVMSFIPGGITLAAGVVCFGPFGGFFFNYLGILLGSCLNFFLARRFGKKLVRGLVSEKTYQKTSHWLNHPNFDRAFFIAILLPGFPDDFLCLVAGLTEMKFRRFLWILLLGKPLTIAAYSFGFTGIKAVFENFLG